MPGIGPYELAACAVAGFLSITFGIGLIAYAVWRRSTREKCVEAPICVGCGLPVALGAVDCPHCGRPVAPEATSRVTAQRIAALLRPIHLLVGAPIVLVVAVLVTPSDLISFAVAALVLLGMYGILVAIPEAFAWRSMHPRTEPLCPCPRCGRPLSTLVTRCPRCGDTTARPTASCRQGAV